MEIIRTTRYLPQRSRPRNSRVVFEKGLFEERVVKEPVRNAKIISETENVDLDEIAAQLEEAGYNLEDEPTLDNFNCFKDSIGKFARKVTTLAYCLDKLFAPSQRPQIITRVKDEGADYLYHNTMNNQHYNIQIASEIGDIKGMILSNCI